MLHATVSLSIVYPELSEGKAVIHDLAFDKLRLTDH
jgi:hypothetical protein